MKYALIVLLIITLAVIAFFVHVATQPEQGPLLGEGKWVYRETPDLTGRWTLLAFFVPDSADCADEVPELLRMRRLYAPDGLTVVGVTPDSKLEAQPFISEHALPYPILVEAGAELELYGVHEVPDAFLVNPEGEVLARGMPLIELALLNQFGESALALVDAPRPEPRR